MPVSPCCLAAAEAQFVETTKPKGTLCTDYKSYIVIVEHNKLLDFVL